jgi:hypothetical protein
VDTCELMQGSVVRVLADPGADPERVVRLLRKIADSIDLDDLEPIVGEEIPF